LSNKAKAIGTQIDDSLTNAIGDDPADEQKYDEWGRPDC
jgi:hypothetical protein